MKRKRIYNIKDTNDDIINNDDNNNNKNNAAVFTQSNRIPAEQKGWQKGRFQYLGIPGILMVLFTKLYQ